MSEVPTPAPMSRISYWLSQPGKSSDGSTGKNSSALLSPVATTTTTTTTKMEEGGGWDGAESPAVTVPAPPFPTPASIRLVDPLAEHNRKVRAAVEAAQLSESLAALKVMAVEGSSSSAPSSKVSTSLFPASMLEPFLPAAGALPANFAMRPLQLTDFHKGYVQLLEQLTSVGEISEELFAKRFLELRDAHPFAYYTVVIEDASSSKVVGSATLVLEWKFIHQCGARGRIEDVVVDSSYRGLSLARHLNECLVKLARHLGVYKLSLECKDSLIPLYEKFGFRLDTGNNFLVQRFDH